MNKFLLPLLLSPVLLTACAGQQSVATSSPFGSMIVEKAIDNKCHSEFNNSRTVQLATILMTADHRAALADKACSCVSEQAPKYVTTQELLQSAVSADVRGQVVKRVVASSLVACTAQFIK